MAWKNRYNSDDDYPGDSFPDYENENDASGRLKSGGGGRLAKDMAARKEEGAKLEPVLPAAARDLAETVWGQAWNNNLQSYADHQSALTKGRTEFRRGKVMDLCVAKGELTSLVAGNRLWDVRVKIAMLDAESWSELRGQCVGQITDVSDLLMGEVPPAVMTTLSRPEAGLFPHPSDLKSICNCTDTSSLCVHAAATLYALGAMIDENPLALFTLRGGSPQDLIAKLDEVLTELTTGPEVEAARQKALEGVDLNDLFGLDLVD